MKVNRITEAMFLRQVLEYAQLNGWRVVHFRPARTERGWRTAVQGNGVGFPDLLLIRGDRILVAELKVSSKLTDQQRGWLLAFGGAGVRAELWTPEDWPQIEEVLRR